MLTDPRIAACAETLMDASDITGSDEQMERWTGELADALQLAWEQQTQDIAVDLESSGEGAAGDDTTW